MKRYLLYAFMICSALYTGAAGFNRLQVHLTEGPKMEIILVSDLKLSFTDTELIATGSDVELTIPRESIVRFAHTLVPDAGIETVSNGGEMKLYGNTLIFNSLPTDTKVDIYTIAGIPVRSLTADDTSIQIDLSELTAGVYIIRVNDKSYKISVQ